MSQTVSAEPTATGPTSAALSAHRIAVRTAVVAASFSVVVAALMLYEFTRRQWKDPFEAAALKALKAAAAKQPANEELKEQIRALDLTEREEYFRQRVFAAAGAILLAGGIAVFLVSAKLAATLRRTLPTPQPLAATYDLESRWTSAGRWAVAGLVVLLIVAAVGLAVTIRGTLPPETIVGSGELGVGSETPTKPPPAAPESTKTPAVIQPSKQAGPAIEPRPDVPTDPAPQPEAKQPSVATAQASYTPSEEDVRNAWPRFRGPDGSGISPYTNLPDTWDAASGKNIVWKTPVALPGNNSPVVCGKRVFLSGADENRRQVYCFDTATGKLLWQQDVPATAQSKGKTPKVQEDVGFASNTLATDGRRIYAIFANGDAAAFDYDGKPVWLEGLGVPDSSYGHAASLLTWNNLLLVPLDQGNNAKGKSKLLALDGATGKTVWEAPRPVPNSWTTPIVVRHADHDQIITVATPWVIAYDAKDGTEIWRAKCMAGDAAPSPVFADGVVFAAASEQAPLCAIRADGKGDVTESHILWRAEDNVPDTCSPLATASQVFALTSGGILTCFDAKKGDKLWEEDLGNIQFAASLSLVGNRLYLLSDKGKCLFIEPGKDACKKLGEADLDERCVASPAFQDGRIYIRGEKNLYCIGK